MSTKKPPQGFFTKKYYNLVQIEDALRHPFLLVIRLYWGILLIMTGIGKWANVHSVGDFFAELHIPLPLFSAYLVGAFEFLGGVSLFLGFLVRIFSIPLVIIFLVAYATAHLEALTSLFFNPSLFVSQDPFLYLFVAIVVLCFGAGAFSVDYWLEKKMYGANLD